MSAASPIRALVTYYWNVWYFLAAMFGALSSLFLGSWISSEANGTPITGGYSFFFTGTQPLISLALLFACDARVSKVHYGGLPRQLYFAWKPCSLRAVFRAIILVALNVFSVLCFDAIMILMGVEMHPKLVTVLFFVVLQSVSISLIYSLTEIVINSAAAGVVSGILLYLWIILPGDVSDNATPYVANALRVVGLKLNGTAISLTYADGQSAIGLVTILPIVILFGAYVCLVGSVVKR